MVVGSHSVKHPDLRGVSDTRLRAELVDSRAAIQKEVGVAPSVLCYPAGAYDARVMTAVRAAGYRVAVTTDVREDPGAGVVTGVATGADLRA